MDDPANGYETCAEEFARRRVTSRIGASHVREWAKALPPGAAVLDVGCGVGIPITQALVESGCHVHAIDASPRMVARFGAHFPDVPVRCEAVESMTHFDRHFDGVVAWGLIFLLPAEAQASAIAALAAAVVPGGELLFTAPQAVSKWMDVVTNRPSQSLGADVYRRMLDEAGCSLLREFDDEGDNHYYQARRRDDVSRR